ncbi:unnamed protein product [Effrenium voratum]|nr:unnamed protein product [Effrenium voratum]
MSKCPTLPTEKLAITADTWSHPALRWAAGRGSEQQVAMLLEARAQLNRTANRGQTALLFALTNNCDDVVTALQERAALEDRKACSVPCRGGAAGDAKCAQMHMPFMGKVKPRFAPDLSSASYDDMATRLGELPCAMEPPECTWTFANDPIQGHELQADGTEDVRFDAMGYWGNPMCAYAKDRNAMPNGFRHELMLRRLALRVDESDGQLRARVALRQENGKVPPWAWPVEGLAVRLVLAASLSLESPEFEAELRLAHGCPVASVELPRRAQVLVAHALSLQILSAFARLEPDGPRYGLLFPLPYRLQEASLLQLQLDSDPYLILPMAVPPKELDDIEFHDPCCHESTGSDIWDPGLVLAAALPQLLAAESRPQLVLELGAGLSLCGLVAALLGHDCVATDAEMAIASTRQAGEENAGLLSSANARWRAEVMDWRSPPSWIVDQQWDVLLGGDLAWSSAREFVPARGREEMLQNPLLQLLSRLRFGRFFLAERERDLEAIEDFFRALECFGFNAIRLDSPTGPSGAALTDAKDIALWTVQHSCILDIPPSPSPQAGDNLLPGQLLEEFLQQHSWLCDGKVLQLISGEAAPVRSRPGWAETSDWERDSSLGIVDAPRLLLLALELPCLSRLGRLCALRAPRPTRLLLPKRGQRADSALQEAIQQGFAVHVLARHRAEDIAIYAIDWNEPAVSVYSFQGQAFVCAELPSAWSHCSPHGLEVHASRGELLFTWEELGWQRQVRLPFKVDLEKMDACRKHKTRLEIKLRRMK